MVLPLPVRAGYPGVEAVVSAQPSVPVVFAARDPGVGLAAAASGQGTVVSARVSAVEDLGSQGWADSAASYPLAVA